MPFCMSYISACVRVFLCITCVIVCGTRSLLLILFYLDKQLQRKKTINKAIYSSQPVSLNAVLGACLACHEVCRLGHAWEIENFV